MTAQGPRVRKAFTLIELLVVIAIIALLVGILLPSLGEARRSARQVGCFANQRSIGTAMATYASDNRDLIYSFTWFGDPDVTRQKFYIESAEIGGPPRFGSSVQAAAAQASVILRRRSGDERFPFQANWIPHVLYSHLVLVDYLSARLPEPALVCPEDKPRQRLQEGVKANPDIVSTLYPSIGAASRRFPYSSTYQYTTALWSPDLPLNGTATRQDGTWATPPGQKLGQKLLGAVAFPGQKVTTHEEFGFHFGKGDPAFFTYQFAKITAAFYDNSVRTVQTSDVNVGGVVYNDPGSGLAQTAKVADVLVLFGDAEGGVGSNAGDSGAPYFYQWPDPLASLASRTRPPRYRWTAGGNRGVDVGGDSPWVSEWPTKR